MRIIHFVSIQCVISILKSPRSINSSPVVCAIESFTSNWFTQSEHALVGRYTLQTRNGLAFGNETSVHKVSMLEVSRSCLLLIVSDFLSRTISLRHICLGFLNSLCGRNYSRLLIPDCLDYSFARKFHTGLEYEDYFHSTLKNKFHQFMVRCV